MTFYMNIGNYQLELKECGNKLMGCCPFHEEKTPSFYISTSENLYRCLGCRKHGTLGEMLEEILRNEKLKGPYIAPSKIRYDGPISKKYANNWLTLAYYGALDQENQGICGFTNTIEEADILVRWIKERMRGAVPKWSKEPSKDNIPPHSIEAEQAVLGALLIDNSSSSQLCGLRASDFHKQEHAIIFEAIMHIIEHELPADIVSVSDHLKVLKQLDSVGDIAYLAELAKNCKSADNVKAYANIVKERSILRQLIAIGSELSMMCVSPPSKEVNALNLLEEAVNKVKALACLD